MANGVQNRDSAIGQAYQALDDYGKRFGRLPLLLMLHAAVPQSLRADLVNLLKINFLPEAGDDLSIDADVLQSPLTESLGGAYFRLAPEVRRHCLALLDAVYRDEPVRRTIRVARFVLTYLHHLEQSSEVSLAPRLAEYITIQRWSAYAFIHPQDTASRFAESLRDSMNQHADGSAARVRFGGLAAAIEIPLAGHKQLLDYARAVDAIRRGDAASGQRLFNRMSDRELTIGDVTLQSPEDVLRQFERSAAEAPGPSKEAAPPSARSKTDDVLHFGQFVTESTGGSEAPDTLQQISDPGQYPFRCVRLLDMETAGGRTRGTGFLVSPRLILTVDYCVRDPTTKRFARQVTIRAADSSAIATEIRVETSRGDDVERPHMGALFLDKPLLEQGWLGVASYTDRELEGLTANIFSYQPDRTMWAGTTRVAWGSAEMIGYEIDTRPGMGGAPVVAIDSNGNHTVIAIHAASDARFGRYGIRITDDRLDLIQKWIAEADARATDETRTTQGRTARVVNPFTTSVPVAAGSRLFVGREREIKEIERHAFRPTSPLILYGARGIGKTSLLAQLSATLPPAFVVVVIGVARLAEIEKPSAVLEELALEVGAELENRKIDVGEFVQAIRSRSSSEAGESSDFTRVFESFLDRIEAVLDKNDLRLLLCLDDYDMLMHGRVVDFAERILDALVLGRRKPERLAALLCGSRRLGELALENAKRFVGRAVEFHLSFLDHAAVRTLLTRPVPKFDLEYDQDALDAITNETNGYPYLVQSVGGELVELLNRQGRDTATLDDVHLAIEGALDSSEPFFRALMQDTGQDSESILRAIANGTSVPNAPQTIDRLAGFGFLKEPNQITIPILERWLRRSKPQFTS